MTDAMGGCRRPLGLVLAGLLLASCGGPDAPAAGAATEADPLTVQAALPGDLTEAGARSVLGTIQATLDGEPRTWYVVAGDIGAQPYASGMWMDVAGERQVIAGGFDTADPPIDTFERSSDLASVSYGDYQGSVLSVLVSEAAGPFPATIGFAAEGIGVSEASVFFQRRATVEDVMASTYWLAEGRMNVTTLAIEGGEARMEGTFSGTFRSPGSAEAIQVAEGRFEIRGIPDMAVLTP